MKSMDDLLNDRELIASLLKHTTDGEIIDFDFIVDHLTMAGRPGIVTIMVAVPGRVKKEYDGNMNALLDKHEDIIRQTISAAGYPELFSRTIRYMVL